MGGGVGGGVGGADPTNPRVVSGRRAQSTDISTPTLVVLSASRDAHAHQGGQHYSSPSLAVQTIALELNGHNLSPEAEVVASSTTAAVQKLDFGADPSGAAPITSEAAPANREDKTMPLRRSSDASHFGLLPEMQARGKAGGGAGRLCLCIVYPGLCCCV